MSWDDRVNEYITLVAPSGATFRPLWIGNKRSKDNKLGVFEYPKAKGAVIQGLKMGAVKEPLTLYFEGPDNDLEAQRFWDTCDEVGAWVILHPTKGVLTRWLVTVTEEIQPVTSGNITEFSTEWIEPDLDNLNASVAQLEDDAREQADNVAAQGKQDLVDNGVKKGSTIEDLKRAVKSALNTALAWKNQAAGYANTITTLYQSGMAVVSSAVAGQAAFAGVISNLVTLPGLMLTDTRARFQYFEKVLDSAFTDIAPNDARPGSAAKATVAELVAVSALTGLARAVIEGEYRTREEALGYRDRINAAFDRMTTGLDAVQALYADRPVDYQFFSQSGSFNDTVELMRRVQGLLLRRSFDLSTAKHITLRKNRAPVEIAITEGVDLDVLISSNNLRGDDILLLPAGRQLVLYR